jgi:hypothetical protein
MYDFRNGERTDEIDVDDNYWYGEIDNFDITSDDYYPTVNQAVDLRIKARNYRNSIISNYREQVKFNVYYRTSASSYRIKTSSSNYYQLNSKYTNGYTFKYTDNGNAQLNDFITFKRNYDYKVEVIDQDDNVSSYIVFEVTGSEDDNNYSVDNFTITTDNTNPTINQRVDLGIRVRDSNGYTISNYRGTVDFNIYYRSSSSSSWIKTTSSTYYELDTNYVNGYTFAYSNNGNITLTDAIRFKRNNYYKVEIVDQSNRNILGYKLFDTYESWNNDNEYTTNNFYVTTDKSTPSINERVDLNIKARDADGYTITDYRGTVKFNIYYRSSSTSSWIKTTSSTYYELDYDYSNGYTFNYGNNGNVNLTDAIRFKRNNYYKVEIVDQSNSSIIGYKLFEVGGSSYDGNLDWFSSTELTTIRNLYNSRDQLIESYKSNYSRLRSSTTWINLSNDLKLEMWRILNNSSLKQYDNYEEFMEALEYRYSYTLSIK